VKLDLQDQKDSSTPPPQGDELHTSSAPHALFNSKEGISIQQ
jgi:hypothetical protein